MTTRAWVLVAAGYAILAIGMLVALWRLNEQTERIDRQTDFLTTQALALRDAAGVFCETSRRTDVRELELLIRIANGEIIVISSLCDQVVDQIFGDFD